MARHLRIGYVSDVRHRPPRRRYEPKELRPSGWWELLACLISLATLALGYWLLVHVLAPRT